MIPSSPLLPCASRDHEFIDGVSQRHLRVDEAGDGISDPVLHVWREWCLSGGEWVARCSCGFISAGANSEAACLAEACAVEALLIASAAKAWQFQVAEQRQLTGAARTV